MATLKLMNVKLADFTAQSDEKYGDSYILANPTVELEGKLYKVNTFKKTIEETVTDSSGNPRVIKDYVTHISLRPVKASVPKVSKPAAKGKATEADFAQFMAWNAAQQG